MQQWLRSWEVCLLLFCYFVVRKHINILKCIVGSFSINSLKLKTTQIASSFRFCRPNFFHFKNRKKMFFIFFILLLFVFGKNILTNCFFQPFKILIIIPNKTKTKTFWNRVHDGTEQMYECVLQLQRPVQRQTGM